MALRQAPERGPPAIFNTDRGAQFTAEEYTSILEGVGVQVSMDGRGRALDNVFVERLWRTLKREHIYLMDCAHVPHLEAGLHGYFQFYNHERPHQSLGYGTGPAAGGRAGTGARSPKLTARPSTRPNTACNEAVKLNHPTVSGCVIFRMMGGHTRRGMLISSV